MHDYHSLEHKEKRIVNIKPEDKTIKELLVSGSQFIIPRFQREYSWDKKNYKEFLEDMLSCLSVNDGKIYTNQYFLGTMLFVGNYAENTDQEIFVVDGQQRLTTITILFSALSDIFLSLENKILSKQIFKYIMTTDDNGETVRILKSKTHYPFFSYYIQDQNKKIKRQPSTEEEKCIEDTYNYMYKSLDEEKLREFLKKKYGADHVDKVEYVDILKAVRDQVLNTTFVSISTRDRKQANMIFEILNAKGKRLSDVDLIKNKIFEKLDVVEPADYAYDKWNNIKEILNNNCDIGFTTFYRHFWISKYKKSPTSKLYDHFNDIIINDKDVYIRFLQELEDNAKLYTTIVNPQRDDYDNRKEYFGIVQSLNVLSNYFNIVQVRIALLALLRAKSNELINLKQLKNCINYLENFHFSYNAIGSLPTNRLETIYSRFAIALNGCTKKEDANKCIEKLVENLSSIYISFQEFEDQFIQLIYSKKENSSNIKTKYALNKINSYFAKTDIFADNGSIEHILPESLSDNNLNIGNLIILEQKLNKDADDLPYDEKADIYKSSNYKWIQQFIEKYTSWDDSKLEQRAKELARLYYTEILGRDINRTF